jgi:hypothetical protein
MSKANIDSYNQLNKENFMQVMQSAMKENQRLKAQVKESVQ